MQEKATIMRITSTGPVQFGRKWLKMDQLYANKLQNVALHGYNLVMVYFFVRIRKSVCGRTKSVRIRICTDYADNNTPAL